MFFSNRKLLRLITSLLALTMLLTGGVLAAFDSGYAYSYVIGNSATYTRQEGKTSAGIQSASYITYTPGTSISPKVVYAGDTIYGSKATISSAASYLQNQGYNVIGGINADFFVMSTGVPIGLVIDNGTLMSSDAWQYAVGFRSDGSAIIGQPSSTMKVEGPSGAVWASYFNKTRTAAGIYLLDSNYDSSTHISTPGRSIVLERLDDTPVKVGGSVRMRVIAAGAGSSATTITSNQMVLTMDDKCQATWIDYPIGEEVTLTITSPDSRWSDVVYAVGGKNLITNGTVSTSGIDGASSNTARTAVAVKPDGTVMLYEVDGRQAGHSVGLTAAQLGNELLSMGYTNAICLDGGGSSALSVRLPGETLKRITTPSDGSERSCANYIFIVSTQQGSGTASHVHMRNSHNYVLPGGSTYFSAWGSDNAYEAAALPSGMTYTATLGEVDSSSQVFKSDGSLGIATITGTSADGAVTGTHTVCVTTAVDTIKLESGGSAVTSLSLRGGATADIDAKAYHLNQQMGGSDDLMTWRVTGDIGTIDANGVFTAAQNPGSGTIVCSYGNTSASIAVSVGLSDPPDFADIADFEERQPITAQDSTWNLTLTSQFNEVAKGSRALSAQYSFSGSTSDLTIPRTSTQNMTFFSLWAMADTSGVTLSAIFEDESGAEIAVPLSAAVPSGSYSQLTASVPADASALTGIRVTKGSSESGTLYLDQILMRATPVNNTDAPVITLTSAPATANEGSTATVTARITMENGKYVLRPSQVTAYVDGVKSSAQYTPSNESISVTTPALTAGLHQVTIEASDDAGNRSRVSVSITAGSSTASQFADTASNWANGYINFAANKNLLQGETSGGVTNFNPARNLRRSEFAVIMARYLGLDTSDTSTLPFSDASSIPSWAAGAISACYKAGIMSGQLDTHSGRTNFNPDANITRAEVMTVISKVLPRGFVPATTSFTDYSSIPAWSLEHVRYTVAAGIFSGYDDGTIRATNNITRAEIAKVLCTLY